MDPGQDLARVIARAKAIRLLYDGEMVQPGVWAGAGR
jgi:hypothetical protein